MRTAFRAGRFRRMVVALCCGGKSTVGCGIGGRAQSVAEALQGAPQVVTVRGRRQGKNGEAVAFLSDSKRYLTLSEGKKQAISEFDVPASE